MKLIKNLLKRHAINRKQKVIPFSVNRKPKTIYQLKADYIGLLANQEREEISPAKKPRLDPDYASDPELMVGKRTYMKQKFTEDGARGEQWCEGCVVAYNANSSLHEVVYNGESEHYFYNLLEDLEDDSLVLLILLQ